MILLASLQSTHISASNKTSAINKAHRSHSRRSFLQKSKCLQTWPPWTRPAKSGLRQEAQQQQAAEKAKANPFRAIVDSGSVTLSRKQRKHFESLATERAEQLEQTRLAAEARATAEASPAFQSAIDGSAAFVNAMPTPELRQAAANALETLKQSPRRSPSTKLPSGSCAVRPERTSTRRWPTRSQQIAIPRPRSPKSSIKRPNFRPMSRLTIRQHKYSRRSISASIGCPCRCAT